MPPALGGSPPRRGCVSHPFLHHRRATTPVTCERLVYLPSSCRLLDQRNASSIALSAPFIEVPFGALCTASTGNTTLTSRCSLCTGAQHAIIPHRRTMQPQSWYCCDQPRSHTVPRTSPPSITVRRCTPCILALLTAVNLQVQPLFLDPLLSRIR
jgi:hypothetical protein